MGNSIAYLGPPGTYAESAALAYASWLEHHVGERSLLCPYPSIAQALKATARGETQRTVVPVENSLEGGVTMTLDTLWQLDTLQIQQALILPIAHALLSHGDILTIHTVYSHPQALAQCQGWLERFIPNAQVIPTNSTTEAVKYLERDNTNAAIASQRAAELYNLPIRAFPINDHPDNCTRFWVLSLQPSPGGKRTSLAFSMRENVPGVLVKPLQIFANRGINLSRIESRPTKRSLGDYLFFVDLEADTHQTCIQEALAELKTYTETLKIFGSYDLLPVKAATIAAPSTGTQ